MNINFRIKHFLSASPFVFVLCFCSCKKLIEVAPPDNQLITSTVFKDSADATSAIIGIYTNLYPNAGFVFGNGAITTYAGLSSDELLINDGSSEENQFYLNSIAVNNSINNGSLWSSAYSLVYQTNACIEGLTASASISTALKNQLLGESKFLRAFIYFFLVNLYSDVPLVTTTNYKISAQLPRASSDSVYTQIIKDLQDAKNLLAADYINGAKTRVNKYTALCLLARVYLYKEQWQLAEETSNQIINCGLYTLEDNLDNVFLANNSESVWQIPPTNNQGVETTEGFFFIPSDVNATPKYVLSPHLLAAFENGDERKQKWLNKNSVQVNGVTTDFYYPFKYKLGYDGNTNPVENYVVFRLAEQYLIKSEALAHLNGLPNALTNLNVIRSRAGLPDTIINSQAALINAIFHERQVEFFCEWGHRWFDLKRSGTINTILANEKSAWQSTGALFPIPLQQIHTNPFLTQNPGY